MEIESGARSNPKEGGSKIGLIAGVVGVVVVIGIVVAVAMGGSGETPAPLSQTSTAAVEAGDTKIPGDFANSGFLVGQDVTIDAGTAIAEDNTITGFGSIILKTPLKYAHGAGAVVSPTPKMDPGTGTVAPTVAPEPVPITPVPRPEPLTTLPLVPVATTPPAPTTPAGPTTTLSFVPRPFKPILGVSYGPAPLKIVGTQVPNDDFWSEQATKMWGLKANGNRGDLEIIKALGANTVRLYGNDPRKQHGKFLEEADELGLGVIIGLSDYPYTQWEGACVTNRTQDCNCFDNIKLDALQLLKHSGLLSSAGSYHESLSNIILINEPELKINQPHHEGSKGYARAVISALDGFLSAEKELGVTGHKPTFTCTFSFAVEGPRPSGTGQMQPKNTQNKPGLGQMMTLKDAFMDPASVGYPNPKNDLKAAYRDRFVNSFNTANYASDIKPLFLDAYTSYFGDQHVYIGEFHKGGHLAGKRLPPGPGNGETKTLLTEMQDIVTIVQDKMNPLMGVSFFEFQVRFDKGGHEMEFGMFGLGETKIGSVELGEFTLPPRTPGGRNNYSVWCLTEEQQGGLSMPKALTQAFGGPGVDPSFYC